MGRESGGTAASRPLSKRARFHHRVVVPFFRFAGYLMMAVQGWVLERYVRDSIDPNFVPAFTIVFAWAFVGTALSRLYGNKWVTMAAYFVDFPIYAIAFYGSGGAESLLFFIPIMRGIELGTMPFRFAVMMVLCGPSPFFLVAGYEAWVDGLATDWGSVFGKSAVVLIANTYLLAAGREARALRDKLVEYTRQARAAADAKTQFIATVSHEIRTPLNGLLGLGTLLSDTELTPRQTEMLAMMRRSGETLLQLINDILDFSKIESGKLELERASFHVRDAVEDIIEIQRSVAREKGLELRSTFQSDVPEAVMGDVTRLRQVLLNLVSNGIKFTETGYVSVEVEAWRDDGGACRGLQVRVRDTGVGIPEDRRQAIFQAFTQADASTTRRFGGTGLGLAICRRLVTAMGGTLMVESELGRGSVFSFCIEAAPALLSTRSKTSERRPVPADLAERHPLRILVAEDNPVNQRVATGLLFRMGYTVDVVANGLEAVRATELHPYDLVLMDMSMPELDGVGASRAIRAAGDSVTIVAMTANASIDDERQCFEAGMQGFLTKPLRSERLAEELVRVHRVRADAGRLLAGPAAQPGDAAPEKGSTDGVQLDEQRTPGAAPSALGPGTGTLSLDAELDTADARPPT